jgi:murein DD-endopeptidase MepM/ murein hydrolase activator NlpD
VAVKAGDRVKRGQLLGKLGNSGNSSAPHLHIHLMDGPTLGSNGLAYVMDHFEIAGQIPPEKTDAVYEFKEAWASALLPKPSPRHEQFPLHLTIVNIPEK